MSIANIETTIESTMRARGYSQYMSYAAPVVEALNAREAQIVTNLLAAVETNQLMSQGEARQALSEAGLYVAPVAVSSNGLSENQAEEVSEIRHAVVGLLERIDRVLG